MGEEPERKSLHEFWEGRWQSGETPWDHGRHAPPWEEFVEREGAPAGRILIPGPGSGHDVRYFADLGAEVTGLDISPSAVAAARKRNHHPNATFRSGNFLDPDPDLLGQFDWVIEHTCLCAMDPSHWEDYARSVTRVLKPQGFYLAIFYRNPHDDAGPPHRIDAETIERLFGTNFIELKAWQPERAYESRAGREELRWFRLRSPAVS